MHHALKTNGLLPVQLVLQLQLVLQVLRGAKFMVKLEQLLALFLKSENIWLTPLPLEIVLQDVTNVLELQLLFALKQLLENILKVLQLPEQRPSQSKPAQPIVSAQPAHIMLRLLHLPLL